MPVFGNLRIASTCHSKTSEDPTLLIRVASTSSTTFLCRVSTWFRVCSVQHPRRASFSRFGQETAKRPAVSATIVCLEAGLYAELRNDGCCFCCLLCASTSRRVVKFGNDNLQAIFLGKEQDNFCHASIAFAARRSRRRRRRRRRETSGWKKIIYNSTVDERGSEGGRGGSL